MMFLIKLLDLTLVLMKFQFFIKIRNMNDEKLTIKSKSEISEEIVDRVIKQIKLKFSG